MGTAGARADWVDSPQNDALWDAAEATGAIMQFHLRPEHAPQLEQMIARHPNVRVIVDHIGKPDIKAKMWEPWHSEIRQLASLPNVLCKVSGMVTEADPDTWTTEDLRPYVEHVLASFGEDRVAFGGDWPVAFQASPYHRWVETLDGLTASLSPAAKRKLWRGPVSFVKWPPSGDRHFMGLLCDKRRRGNPELSRHIEGIRRE